MIDLEVLLPAVDELITDLERSSHSSTSFFRSAREKIIDAKNDQEKLLILDVMKGLAPVASYGDFPQLKM
jgi:hypothetical protein